MKLELNESTKKFIETLSDEDLTKATITESTFESENTNIYKKWKTISKNALKLLVVKLVLLHTRQFMAEHPEYFKNN